MKNAVQNDRNSKLYDLIEAGFQKQFDLNCAETILFGANEVYGLGLSPESLKLAAGFGGGMCTEKDCGVVTGMVMVLSSVFAEGRGHTSPNMKLKIQEAIKLFEEAYSCTNCKVLKEEFRSETTGCHDLIATGGRILDSLL